jgi:hypothetical protein
LPFFGRRGFVMYWHKRQKATKPQTPTGGLFVSGQVDIIKNKCRNYMGMEGVEIETAAMTGNPMGERCRHNVPRDACTECNPDGPPD